MTCNNTTKSVTIVNVEDSSSHTFDVDEENKLPLNAITDAFGLTRVELASEPGILSFDIHGICHIVPFKFGDTVCIRGVPVERSLTAQRIDKKLEEFYIQID